MYHAIIIEESLADKSSLNNFRILNTKIDGDWHLHVIEIPDIEKAIEIIQPAMVIDDEYYWHIFDDGNILVVVFRDKAYRMDPADKLTWKEAQEHGANLGIARHQLDFYPLSFSDEPEWLAGRSE